MKRIGLAAALASLSFTLCAATADASARGISNFAQLNSGPIVYNVRDMTSPLLLGSPVTADFTLTAHMGVNPGSVTLTEPVITGSGGGRVPTGNFQADCTATSDPGSIFTASGRVRLNGSTPVTCATLAATADNTVQFSVTLYLDTTPGAYAFPADTYTAGTLTVTVNTP